MRQAARSLARYLSSHFFLPLNPILFHLFRPLKGLRTEYAFEIELLVEGESGMRNPPRKGPAMYRCRFVCGVASERRFISSFLLSSPRVLARISDPFRRAGTKYTSYHRGDLIYDTITPWWGGALFVIYQPY